MPRAILRYTYRNLYVTMLAAEAQDGKTTERIYILGAQETPRANIVDGRYRRSIVGLDAKKGGGLHSYIRK